ncbi:hypothetical protein [Paraburkholderia phenoliruptrix]|uniref:hypothetical protein n=1 Tax=Paraburkholderia phenoliruptrix TaxID=252970 RepID=UPI002865061D|nr:hypothetical protein [Paraburkholderia phenoliruptrix]MDR6388440.1 hypothetical protein [Paraburkholderia phenoliruptrix]
MGLDLVPDSHGQITSSLEVARQLWANQFLWIEKVKDFSATRLLDLKNESRLDADGACEFWLDDGALFSGHPIVVRGSLSDGLVDAEIAG